MDGQLKAGTILRSRSECDYTIEMLLGSGGQGEVYRVSCNGTEKALKWYFPKMATRMQRDILDDLLAKGAPDSSFLWPEDLIESADGSTYGYIMPLRPQRYRSIVDLMKGRVSPSFQALCRAAYQLTLCYQKLHGKGYSYRDISFGNVFFDPDTGDVMICDNDNVAPNGQNCGVYGTPCFMAPEIVRGEAKPSRNTDQFSLAVLLFYMFMVGHPLEGRLEYNIKCKDVAAQKKLYGTDPVFIFDPNNDSNRPVAGYQDNPLIYWELYPAALKKLFIRSFTEGLQPNRRVTENEWLKVLSNMLTGIMHCSCGAEVFYDAEASGQTVCWHCGNPVPAPAVLEFGKNRIVLEKGAKLYDHNLTGNFDMSTVAGTLVQNPNDPRVFGLRNDTDTVWNYQKPDGTSVQVPPGRSARIMKGAILSFGKNTAEIK